MPKLSHTPNQTDELKEEDKILDQDTCPFLLWFRGRRAMDYVDPFCLTIFILVPFFIGCREVDMVTTTIQMGTKSDVSNIFKFHSRRNEMIDD